MVSYEIGNIRGTEQVSSKLDSVVSKQKFSLKVSQRLSELHECIDIDFGELPHSLDFFKKSFKKISVILQHSVSFRKQFINDFVCALDKLLMVVNMLSLALKAQELPMRSAVED